MDLLINILLTCLGYAILSSISCGGREGKERHKMHERTEVSEEASEQCTISALLSRPQKNSVRVCTK